MDAPTLLKWQAMLNSAVANEWENYRTHREHVMRLVLEEADRNRGRLCVLGAGNCNDLDLTAVSSAFDESHLFDIDGAALDRAVERCAPANRSRIKCHDGVDLSTTTLPSYHGFFDLVLSACLLSQLIDAAVVSVPRKDPSATREILVIRNAHLRLMLDLVVPGGTALLVSDLVSSDTAGQLHHVSEQSDTLVPLLLALIAARNFFTGTNPFSIRALLTSDSMLAPHVQNITLQLPWLWQLSKDRVYLVYALSWRRMQSGIAASC
jgi:hypothetical protein